MFLYSVGAGSSRPDNIVNNKNYDYNIIEWFADKEKLRIVNQKNMENS